MKAIIGDPLEDSCLRFRTVGELVPCSFGKDKYKPFPGGATALASAGAVEVLAKCLAKEAAPIRVNVICPGLVDTPLLRGMFTEGADEAISSWTASFPVPRAGGADEVADVFLVGNGYVKGEVIVIDGG